MGQVAVRRAADRLEATAARSGYRRRRQIDHPPDADALVQDQIEISVQVNGKMRARISVAVEATQDEVVAVALVDANVQKYVEGKPIRKAIYVKGKLLNIVV